MSSNRILVLGFLFFFGLGLAFFFLPTSVVENQKKLETSEAETGKKKDAISESDSLHSMPPESNKLILDLKSNLSKESNLAKKVSMLTEVGNHYLKTNRFDSAGSYFEKASKINSGPNLIFKAGSAYFEGIAFATTPSKIEVLSEKTRNLLSQIPETDPKATEAKAKMAMTWVNSATPMKGILKLRELAEKEPENEFVAYQLGILSFQSGQYDKAVARFEKVLKINPKSVNGHFYLAQSLTQLGRIQEALIVVENGLPLAKEEDTKASFQEMKKQLTEN